MSLQSQIDILALGLCNLYKKILGPGTGSGSGCTCGYSLNINNIRSIKCDPAICYESGYNGDYLVAININNEFVFNEVLTTNNIFDLTLLTHSIDDGCQYCNFGESSVEFITYTNITSISNLYYFF